MADACIPIHISMCLQPRAPTQRHLLADKLIELIEKWLRSFGQNGNERGTDRATELSAVMIYAVAFHLLHIIPGKPLTHFRQPNTRRPFIYLSTCWIIEYNFLVSLK